VTFSALILCGLLLAIKPELLRIRANDLWRFGLLGVVGVAGANFFYYFAIKESTVATAILLQYTAPFMVLAYSVAIHEERFTPVKLVAASISLAGCYLAVGGYQMALSQLTPLALASALGSAFCFAFMIVYSRLLLRRYSRWTTIFYAFVAASIFWAFVNPPWRGGMSDHPASLWGTLIVFAVFSILLPYALFIGGLRYIVPTRTIIIGTVEPIVAIVSAALLLGEYLTLVQTVGALFVLLAILLLYVRPEEEATVVPDHDPTGTSNDSKRPKD